MKISLKSASEFMRKLFRKFKRFNSYTLKNKILIIKVFILSAVFRMAMLYIPFKKLKTYMGDLNKESSSDLSEDEYKEAARISWAIKKAVRYTPWESKCLVQSLTAQYLLYHKGIESTLYLGVSRENIIKNQLTKNDDNRKSDFIAHSWIRCGKLFVTGGNGEGFAAVARFRKGF